MRLGDYTLKVNRVIDPFTSKNSFSSPDKGNKFVAVDVSVKNTSSEPQTVSAIMCFSLRDGRGQGYDMDYFAGGPKPPDAEVGPGRFIKGTLTYQVPKNAKGLTLEFKCDLLSTGSAYIALD